MKKYVPADALQSPRFCGTAGFMRLPQIKTTDGVDVAFLGIPFDTATTHRVGSRFAPAAIREDSRLLRPYNPAQEIAVFEHVSAVDYGDIDIVPGYIERTYERIVEAREELGEDCLPDFLGEVPIEKDGSFNIEVPANTPIELQTLDADGLALRTCSWIWAKNHEPRGCIGCHEDGELTPENTFQKAFEGPSVVLCPPAEKRRMVDFRRHVMPIVSAKCVPCHRGGKAPPRLDGGMALVKHAGQKASFSRAYESLLAREKRPGAAGYGGKYVQPGQARNSRLMWHILGRNTARPWDGARRKEPAKLIRPGKVAPRTLLLRCWGRSNARPWSVLHHCIG